MEQSDTPGVEFLLRGWPNEGAQDEIINGLIIQSSVNIERDTRMLVGNADKVEKKELKIGIKGRRENLWKRKRKGGECGKERRSRMWEGGEEG